MVSITDLPFEILEKILSSTNGYTLYQCRSVCKHFKSFIDENDALWKIICEKEIKFSSRIAKRKCGDELTWYEVYRNIKKWSVSLDCEKNVRKFYHFVMKENHHAIDLDYNVLPLKENRGIILYDMKTMRYMPVVMPEKSCKKMSHNDIASVAQFKYCILLQRNEQKNQNSEAFFKADNYVLTDNELYFYNNRDVFKCDLHSATLAPQLLHHSDFDLREMQHSDSTVHLFTDCGKILSINSDNEVKISKIKCPDEWVAKFKHVVILDDKNYVCYSRNIFQIRSNDYEHLYSEFPSITSLFFYGDVILIGTRAGEILLYRLASQKEPKKPVFEKIAVLPNGHFPTTLDIYERKRGPLIVASSWFDVYVVEINLFTEDECRPTKRVNPMSKLHLYKRLMKLKDRARNTKL